jgi:hypothetical protein
MFRFQKLLKFNKFLTQKINIWTPKSIQNKTQLSDNQLLMSLLKIALVYMNNLE